MFPKAALSTENDWVVCRSRTKEITESPVKEWNVGNIHPFSYRMVLYT